MKRFISLITVGVILLTSVQAFSFEPFFEYEAGAISILSHTYQNGETRGDGDLFDFRNEGGQDVLYPFERFQVGARIEDRHRLWFSYQPLELVTDVTFREDREIGDYTFVAGTPMKLTYSFPFYRVSYTYDLLGTYENAYLGPGLVLQIRNASIRFESLTAGADSLFVTQNVGVVPALALYSEYRFPFGLTLSADIAGSYADSAFFNGADFDFSGSILDASLRMSYQTTEKLALFGNLRYFGGTSDGASDGDDSWSVSETNYSQNNIASITASVGAVVTF